MGLAPESGSVEQSVWQRVHEQLDPLRLRPQARPDIVVRRLEASDRRPYYMAKSPRAGTYVRLTERERELLELMDGSRTVKQIVLADFAAHKSLAYNRVIQLVFLLQAQSFLVDSWVPTYVLVRQRLRAPRGLRARAARVVDFLFGREISIAGIDPLITALYRSVGWALFARPTLVLFAVVALAGLLVFELERAVTVPLTRFLAGDAWLAV